MLATVLSTVAFVIPLELPSNGRIDSLRPGNISIATVRVAARQLSHSAIVESLREARLELNRGCTLVFRNKRCPDY